jgi:DNA topoisomerase IB
MAAAQRRRRLRRSDCSEPGLHRRRRGRGFSYVDDQGNPVRNRDLLERVRGLAIPPAWQDVWICRDPLGHLQATGIDAAGRKQYLYHASWREHRDREKFERMAGFGARLAKLRRDTAKELEGKELSHGRVLACAVRLLDVGMFRIGSEQYAADDGGIGLATIRRDHVSVRDGAVVFAYPAKGGVRRAQVIDDPPCMAVVEALRRRRGGPAELLAYRERRRWWPLRSDEINEYLKAHLGSDFSAKDFRTWNATVMAAVSLATDGLQARSKSARKRACDRAVKAVAELLGNTPAVARRSYIDPRVFDRYLSGWTIAGELERIPRLDPSDNKVRARIERALLDLLASEAR